MHSESESLKPPATLNTTFQSNEVIMSEINMSVIISTHTTEDLSVCGVCAYTLSVHSDPGTPQSGPGTPHSDGGGSGRENQSEDDEKWERGVKSDQSEDEEEKRRYSDEDRENSDDEAPRNRKSGTAPSVSSLIL